MNRRSCRYAVALSAVGMLFTRPVVAQEVTQQEVPWWQVYGAPTRFEVADAVPGRGAVTVASEIPQDTPWAAAASMPVPLALEAGDPVTALLWVRASQPTQVPLAIHGGAPEYPALASRDLVLDATWRCATISGTAPEAFPAGSQSLTLQLGHAGTQVSLGPVAFVQAAQKEGFGACDFAGFRPDQLAQDVRIAADQDVELAGTLHLPTSIADAPTSAVLLLAGDGEAPRGLYPLLVERLAAAGIATLEYDKRGVGQSTGTFDDTIEQMTRDAAATLAWLRAQPGIDARRIAVLGLSQGGVVVANLGAEDPTLAAIAMLSGPAGEQGTLFIDAMRVTLVGGGMSAASIDQVLSATTAFMDARADGASFGNLAPLSRRLHAAFVKGGTPGDTADSYLAALNSEGFLSKYRAAPSAALRQIATPLLAMYGQADVERNLASALLALSDNPDATVVALPGVDHFLNHAGPDQPAAWGRPVPLVGDGRALDNIVSWLVKRLNNLAPL